MLKETIPSVARIAFLTPSRQGAQTFVEEAQTAASALGVALVVVEVQAADYERAFVEIRTERAGAVLVQGTPIFNRDRRQIIALAARHGLPAIYEWQHHAEEGGLMAYGGNLFELLRRVASYVDRILKGAKPIDLPVEQPTKYHLVINLKTARILSLTIPQSVVLRADQVIE